MATQEVTKVEQSFDEFVKRVAKEVLRLSTEYSSAEYQKLHTTKLACRYTMGDVAEGPAGCYGCIIGQAIVRTEPRFADYLTKLDQQCEEGVRENPTAETLMQYLCFSYFDQEAGASAYSSHTAKLIAWMQSVQSRQDRHFSWGDAVLHSAHKFPAEESVS